MNTDFKRTVHLEQRSPIPDMNFKSKQRVISEQILATSRQHTKEALQLATAERKAAQQGRKGAKKSKQSRSTAAAAAADGGRGGDADRPSAQQQRCFIGTGSRIVSRTMGRMQRQEITLNSVRENFTSVCLQ